MVQARASTISARLNIFEDLQQKAVTKSIPSGQLSLTRLENAPVWTPVHSTPFKYVGQRSLCRAKSTSDELAQGTLSSSKSPSSDRSIASFEIQELMLHAIAQTAIGAFESTSKEIFSQDGYMIDECGQLRSKTFAYAENLRYRVRHRVSSFRTALGCVWVRRTIIDPRKKSKDASKKSQTVTSVVFYPTTWLQCFGLRCGLESVMASAGRSWLFNCRLTVTRAVPEDSLIFELC